ncbi:hypothetical protein [Bacillus albus]|uniref:hypothetical protein n=1 Tax=Bacillus albus TaxID=2026189 RepID=UPI0023A44FE9|nr:hypothetical protein [Bacillus albus]MDD8006937.1 hypothetical protein [Bacillus albus]
MTLKAEKCTDFIKGGHRDCDFKAIILSFVGKNPSLNHLKYSYGEVKICYVALFCTKEMQKSLDPHWEGLRLFYDTSTRKQAI